MRFELTLCGMRVEVVTEDAGFVAYCRAHFGDALGAERGGAPELAVELLVQPPLAGRPPAPPLAACAHWSALSKGFRARDDRLVWWPQRRFPCLEIESRWDGAQLGCRARYLPPAAAPDAEAFRRLSYFLFYYPAMWWRGIRDGLAPIHAGAAVCGERASVFIGPAGCGKSTLALLLARAPEWRLLSENLALTDGHRLEACREPVVLKHAGMRDLLGAAWSPASELEPTCADLVGADFGHWTRARRAEQARAALLLFPQLNGAEPPRRLAPDEARRRLDFALRNCWELEGYQRYASAMDVHFGTDSQRREPVLRLLESAPCHAYTVRAGAPLEEVESELRLYLERAEMV